MTITSYYDDYYNDGNDDDDKDNAYHHYYYHVTQSLHANCIECGNGQHNPPLLLKWTLTLSEHLPAR